IALDLPAATLHGHLVVDSELPAGASVQLVPLDLDHAMRVAQVDGRGNFEIAGVPHGRWRVEGSAPGPAPLGGPTGAIGGAAGEVAVRLSRTGTVSGRVVDPNGTPIANATLVLRDQVGTQMQRPITLTASRLRWIHPLAGARVVPSNDSSRFAATRPGQ